MQRDDIKSLLMIFMLVGNDPLKEDLLVLESADATIRNS